jgi:tetratricopeptide (TPR) repeat protein
VALVLGDSDPAWLEVAVRVYRELLRLDTRKRSPDENASTKSNFGHAIVNLAAHKQSPALFSEGISILEALLNDPLLKGASLGRGIILHTLGNAYSRYGVLEKSEQYIERGLGYIRESVLIFAKTRKDQPAMWVSAQMNIGVGLIALANLTGRNQPLRQAQLPLRKALQGSAGLRHSVLHFEVSRLLGDACRIWGRREDSSRLLIQAATAYRRALAPIYRELQPLDWQATQHELGKVLMRLSEFDEAAFKNNQKLWSGALEAFRMELQIPGENAARRAVTIGYMGNLFVRVGMANRDVQPLNEAVSSFSMALLLLAEAGEAQSSYAKIIGASMEQAKTLIAEIEQ